MSKVNHNRVRQLNEADAERFLEVRTQGFGNRSQAACGAIDLSERECSSMHVLGEGRGLILTPQKRTKLEEAGYPKAFLDKISGIDGRITLERRARWLGDQLSGTEVVRENRFSALRELREIRDISDLPKEAFLKVLGDEDYIIRDQAVSVLVLMGPSIVPDLIFILERSTNAQARESAAEILGQMGDKTVEAIPVVLSLLDPGREPELWVRIKAARALRQMVPYCLMDDPHFDLKPIIAALDKMAKNDPISNCQREAQNTLTYL